VTATTPSSVSLAWNGSSDRWAFWYEVLMDGAVISTASSTSARVRHVPPGAHTFAVRARDNGGNLSELSNLVPVSFADTGDTTPPAAPSGLTATDVHDFCGGQILDWAASADAVEYEIYLNGRFFDLVTGTTVFAYASGGTNTWTVVAVDAAGNSSAPSNPATLTVVADESLC
jgi:hypothetical protein